MSETVLIPAGEYMIGHRDIAESEAPNPVHAVRLSAFAMARYPVTNRCYRAFVRGTGAPEPTSWADPRFSEPDHPVVCVSWDDAMAYCAWVGGTLPTEAQWEVAARGTTTYRYPWGDEEPDAALAHFAEDWNRSGTAPVDARPEGRSPMGCDAMAGNVWEWCLDAWAEDAHLQRSGVDPQIRSSSDIRPLRGGCWRSIPSKLQNAYRNWFHRVAAHVTIGFRVCFSVDGAPTESST